MNKFMALLPLLGWFYLSVIGFGLVYYFVPQRVRSLLYKTCFMLALISSVVLGVRSFQDEIVTLPEAKKSFFEPFEKKIEHEAGNYYPMYYETFRSHLHRGDIVNLVGVPSREYHYARMYLYPAGVVQADELPQESVLAVIGEGDIKRYKGAEILARGYGKYLIRTNGVGK